MSRKLITIVSIALLIVMTLTACGGSKVAAATGSKLGFGAVTNIAKSTDATAEKAGNVQVYTSLAAVTIDDDGRITNVWIDSIQSNVGVDTAGKVTTDLKKMMETKREIGDAYGMKKQSKLGKEWWEQADALEKALIGKTKADLAGMMTAEGKAAGDVAASVSITVTDYLEAVSRAIDSAE
ncbi:MAG: hypothetical protein GX749_03230 [Ruminococcaceae bacterium]|nr:hypothetical protein [Oscillospiraceae bacterium]